ncbi:MAG TPA: SLC13 family permease, partial [Thermoanaerobaculia bacterium]
MDKGARPWLRLFIEDEIAVIVAAAVAAVLLFTRRVALARVPQIIDWTLLLVLFALLVAVELLRDSNLLDRAVLAFVGRFRSARTFTLALVGFTGVLSALVTNDVALFVVIPFTVLASRYTDLRVRHAVILEVVAANLLGCLTPIGNPQNLFLYHRVGWSAAAFMGAMVPFVVWSLIGLLIAIWLLEPKKRIVPRGIERPSIDRTRALAGAVCFVLVVLEIAHVLSPWPAAIAAALATPILLRARWKEMDLSIIPLFFFAFIVVEGLRTLPAY